MKPVCMSIAVTVLGCAAAQAQTAADYAFGAPALLNSPATAVAAPVSYRAPSYGRTAAVNYYYTPADNNEAEAAVPQNDLLPPPTTQSPSDELPHNIIYHDNQHAYEHALEGHYGDCCHTGGCTKKWFGYLGGLLLTRDKTNNIRLTDDPGTFILGTRDASVNDYNGGWEVRIGRQICCDRALEFTYWGVDPWSESWGVDNSQGILTSALYWDRVGFDPLDWTNDPVGDYMNNSSQHFVRRQSEVHNFELNLIRMPALALGYQRCGWNVDWSCGVRYLRFRDDLTFLGVEDGFVLGQDPDAEVFYHVDATNNLIGFQVGARAEYAFHPCVVLYLVPKVGLYGNHIRQSQRVIRGTGDIAYDSQGREFDLQSTKDDVSMLGELDLGLAVRLTTCISARMGYRVIGISGVALSDNQIPHPDMDDYAGILDIDSNGSVLLHGGYAGLEFAF